MAKEGFLILDGLIQYVKSNICTQTVAYAGGGWPSLKPENFFCRKMMLFSKAPFLAAIFPKIDKNGIFHWIFIKISPPNWVFRQNARKFNAGFLKIDQNNAIFFRKCFPNFRNFCLRGPLPPDPLPGPSWPWTRSKFFPAYANALNVTKLVAEDKEWTKTLYILRRHTRMAASLQTRRTSEPEYPSVF